MGEYILYSFGRSCKNGFAFTGKKMAFEKLLNAFRRKSGNKKEEKKLKLGIALGSGGAKGMAEIGVLRAFEEENIKFDVVAGSSIGSIVGGMYARGFSTANMTSFLKELEITDPQRLIMYKLQGMTVCKLLDNMLGCVDFDELTLPFAAVAVDIDKGEQVVLREGNVAQAMCASAAIPPVFKAVTIDGRRLVDGAYMNNVPADVVKQMGADFVVGVTLGAEVRFNDKIKPALDSAYKENKVPVCNRALAGEKFSDFYLMPDLSAYSSASYKNLEEMFDIGYNLAKEMMPEIKKAIASAEKNIKRRKKTKKEEKVKE